MGEILQSLMYCGKAQQRVQTYLYIVTLVVVAAFAEKPMMYHAVDVELVEKRVTILRSLV